MTDKEKYTLIFTLKQQSPDYQSDNQGIFNYILLSHKDSNLNRQIQKLQCYHYTMRQFDVGSAKVIFF